MKPAPGQLDLFADAETEARTEQRLRTPRCLFHSTARGLTIRAAEFAAWVTEFGNDCAATRAHAWTLGMCVPDKPTNRCQASVMKCNMRRPDTYARRYAAHPDCDCYRRCPDELLYRGVCTRTGCNWEAPTYHDRENPAVEDAMDHAWPGWRDVPIVTSPPFDHKGDARWLAKVVPLYPDGWIENGGPVRTERHKFGTRHHGPATPHGGYDMGVLTDDQEATP